MRDAKNLPRAWRAMLLAVVATMIFGLTACSLEATTQEQKQTQSQNVRVEMTEDGEFKDLSAAGHVIGLVKIESDGDYDLFYKVGDDWNYVQFMSGEEVERKEFIGANFADIILLSKEISNDFNIILGLEDMKIE